MQNLAGVKKCDSLIQEELRQAGIPVVSEDRTKCEVPATIAGQLGNFSFVRAWYYWVVVGDVPLKVAEKLYDDPVGKKDVRVVGHCACPPPERWADWYDHEGRRLIPADQQAKLEKLAKDALVSEEEIASFHFADPKDFPALGMGYITSYHIDSQEGLNLFVKVITEAGLV